jgi:predicted DNA-binding protein
MKTAISLPDETFDRASRRAKDLGMSRSEFFARAANRYLEELDAGSVTRQIDDAVERIGRADESAEVAVEAGRRLLQESPDGW